MFNEPFEQRNVSPIKNYLNKYLAGLNERNEILNFLFMAECAYRRLKKKNLFIIMAIRIKFP